MAHSWILSLLALVFTPQNAETVKSQKTNAEARP